MLYLENLFNQISQIGVLRQLLALIIVIIAILINKIIIFKIFKFLEKITLKTNNFIDDTLIKALEKPFKLFILFKGFYYALLIIEYDKLNLSDLSLMRIEKIVIFILISFFLYNLTLENSFLYKKMGKKDSNNVVFPFFAIIIRILIIIVVISLLAKELGFSGFLTGLGISGVAFALMAQDTFSNLFGGVLIALDRPFDIGDWIQTEKTEGIVEVITFRSTKIRTFSMSLVTIPNSKLANDDIINWSKRDLRRINFKLTLKGNTKIDKIEKVVEKIKDLIEGKDSVKDNLIIVSFNEISTYGYGIFIYFYTREMIYLNYEKLKEEINLGILKILKEEGIELMFISINLEDKNLKELIKKNNLKNIENLESSFEILEEELGK